MCVVLMYLCIRMRLETLVFYNSPRQGNKVSLSGFSALGRFYLDTVINCGSVPREETSNATSAESLGAAVGEV